MDSAYYNSAVIATIRRNQAYFSVTVPMNSSVQAAIASIPGDAWTGIEYPQALWDEQLDCWVSDAEVAEVEYAAFTSKPKKQQVTARLIVRRVRAKNEKAARGQDELFPAWRHHAVFTDSPFEIIQAEGQHRDHAIIEQVNADLYAGALAHLPSGHFPANAAWLVIAAMAHNLLRAAGTLAAAGTRRPAPPRSAATSSPSAPAPPATAAGTSSSTCGGSRRMEEGRFAPRGVSERAPLARGHSRGTAGDARRLARFPDYVVARRHVCLRHRTQRISAGSRRTVPTIVPPCRDIGTCQIGPGRLVASALYP